MKNKNILVMGAFICGMLILGFAFTIDTLLPTIAEDISELKWILVGIATCIIGYALSTILISRMHKKDPALAKQAKINENDERFLIIRKTSAYYTWFVTFFSLLAMMLTFTILNLTIAVWFVVVALLLHILSICIFIIKLDKKM